MDPTPSHGPEPKPRSSGAVERFGEKEPRFGGVPSAAPHRGTLWGGEQREERTSRGRHLPWQRPAAGNARLQFEGTAEAGAGPGLPAPSPGPGATCPNGQRGGGPGPGSRTSIPCQEPRGKDKGKLSSLRAEQAPEEPSDIETICEGFGRRERAAQASPGLGGCFSRSFQDTGDGGRWLPEGPGGAPGLWGRPGAVGVPRQRSLHGHAGAKPRVSGCEIPGCSGIRSRPPPTRARGMKGRVGDFGGVSAG